jgi:hypothetical protein
MSLFEFLMILLSIIVGLGIAEVLNGIGRIMRAGRILEMGWIHTSLALLVFLALLQIFWESWPLQRYDTWTFPAMAMMLTAPICLHLIAHIMFPSVDDPTPLEEHYFKRCRVIWALALIALVINTAYRPIAFGQELAAWDNLSSAVQLVFVPLLMISLNRRLHYFLVPLGAALIALDTLAASYFIR